MRLGIALVTLAVVPALPVSAQATSVAIESGPVSTARVVADPGERNSIELSVTINGFTVDDVAPVTAGAGCHPSGANQVACPDPTAAIRVVRVAAGDEDDLVASFLDSRFRTYLDGGAGRDRLHAGEDSPTVFTGGPGDDELRGGRAGDLFLEGGVPSGSDLIEGDAFDSLYEATGEPDVVSYRDRVEAVAVDLDGTADDGARGERDQVAPDIESIIGGRGSDRLVGNRRPNFITGRSGADFIAGRGGRDRLLGGRGNDEIRSRDRRIEPVFCGPGFDRVFADRREARGRSCERRLRA